MFHLCFVLSVLVCHEGDMSQVGNNTIESLIIATHSGERPHGCRGQYCALGRHCNTTSCIPPSVPPPPSSPSSHFFPRDGCFFHTLLLRTPIIQYKLPDSRGVVSRQRPERALAMTAGINIEIVPFNQQLNHLPVPSIRRNMQRWVSRRGQGIGIHISIIQE